MSHQGSPLKYIIFILNTPSIYSLQIFLIVIISENQTLLGHFLKGSRMTLLKISIFANPQNILPSICLALQQRRKKIVRKKYPMGTDDYIFKNRFDVDPPN